MNLNELVTNLPGVAFILLFLILILLFYFTGRKRGTRFLRDIPAFGRLRHSVGLSVEAGSRVHFSLGRGVLTGLPTGISLAGMTLLERIARAASSSDRPPVATSGEGTLAILSQDVLKSAYRSMNVESQYEADAGRFTGATPFAFAAGAMTLIKDENISTNILLGHFGSEAALIADAGEQSSSLTIAGSDEVATQAVLYAMAQEPLIGEEAYASGAYLGAGAVHVASLRAQDILRWIIAAVILAGALAKLAGLL